jgi:ATP-dependent helicase/nuclease subunit B
MRAFLKQLAEICDKYRWQTKWILVPSHALGRVLGERLVRDEKSWANLRFVPPADLALQMAGPKLAEKGISILDEDWGPALVLKLLIDLPADVPAYFRPLADQLGMAEALWSAVSDLRLAGCSSDDLASAGFASQMKQVELQSLVNAYEQYLVSANLADKAAVLREAADRPGVGPIAPSDLLIELPDTCTSALERQFVDSLSATRIAAQMLRIPELPETRRHALLSPGVELRDIPLDGITDARRLAWLLVPTTAPPPRADGTLEMFRSAGVEAEIEEVFRRIASRKLPLDTVEIACAQVDRYPGLLWEKAQRYGWPITLQMGVPAVFTRPVRALLAFCDWLGANFSAEGLSCMLQSGDLDPALGDDLSANVAARIVRRSGAIMGRETYAQSLAAATAADRLRAEDPEIEQERRTYYEKRAAQTQRVQDWIGDLLATIPITSAAEVVCIGDLVGTCAAFVKHSAVRSPEDGAAVPAIIAALDSLRPMSDLRRPAAFVLGLVRSRIARLRVCVELPRPGALHIASLGSAGYTGRACTFVLGLGEGEVFPSKLEDPVLLDADRAALLPDTLANSHDRVIEGVHAYLHRLGNLEGRVCLSFSCRDLRKGRETFPSWVLLNVLLLKPQAALSYRELNEYLGEPVSVVPREPLGALSDAGWWLATLRGEGPAAITSVMNAFIGLERGGAAESLRNGLEFTGYDGLVPEAGPVLDIRNPQRAVSTSVLESFAGCPFRHFLQHGLELAVVDKREEDSDAWLKPDERGTLLHSLYAQFLRELRGKGRRPVPADRDRLRAIATEGIERMRAQIPPPSESVFARDTGLIVRDLELFLSSELAEPGRTPVALEVSFGYADEDESETLSTREPVSIDLGDGQSIRLRGRIDRIDRLSDGLYEVIDYKTGSLYRDLYDGAFAGGRLLQHALYSRAAQVLLRKIDPAPRLAASSYYFATERGAAQRVSFSADLDVRPLLRDLAEAIATGTFPQTADDNACKWCDYARGCTKGGVAQSAAKLESGTAALAAYRRLNAHP